MASKSSKGQKKTRTGKTSTQKKKTTIQVEKKGDDLSKDIILWTVLAVSILLFVSNLGVGGVVGNAVSGFFFGVFGLTAYLFPIVLLVGTFFAISNKENTFALMKLIFSLIFLVFLCTLIELMFHGNTGGGAVYSFFYSRQHRAGGGFVGGGIAGLLCEGFGLIGAYVITIAVMGISAVLISEKSAIKGIQKNARHLQQTEKLRLRKKKSRQMEEIPKPRLPEQKTDRKLPRRERKVEGVALDTQLRERESSPDAPSDEVNEVNIRIFDEQVEVADVHRVPLTSETPSEETLPLEETSSEPDRAAAKEPVGRKTVALKSKGSPAGESVLESERKAEIPSGPVRESAAAQKALEGEGDGKDNVPAEQPYRYPPISLLHTPSRKGGGNSKAALQETAAKLQQILKNFGVNVTVTDVSCGPAVTRYEIQPEMGVKVSKIVNLADDIKLNLAAADIRIEAPIPGKAAVGIEVPNKQKVVVSFRELVESPEFQDSESKISFAVGRDIAGKVVISNIAKMPHLLIAGATGSGKSVCINTIIMSILYKASPKEVKLIMVDPKVVELSVYNGIPHLLIPVVTDPKKAAGALHWAVTEMMDRYEKFADAGVRDMKGYNAKIKNGTMKINHNGQMVDVAVEKMPQIVIIVDELADLMMVAASEVEESICRLAQLARAAGIHLIIATQRPSVNVITGLIKANMPSRIAFSVTSNIDSRTILDMGGAEKLLGNGDMLYYPQGFTKPLRVQGAFVTDDEVAKVVDFLSKHNEAGTYSEEIQEKIASAEIGTGSGGDGDNAAADSRDAYFEAAGRLLIEKEKGSIGMLQRNFKVGFNRAARIMDQLQEAGVVGPEEGTKPRKVLMSLEAFEQIL
ncbi:MAG TPA: DNA translocase FtsK [Candidatus Pullilachnospira gallistercoris]|uniref:DNA translocase FtsK n=1 Tax=Candidatus Pullilachnospira gallistercoris TaxID=2840911 RepID=A0A9D1E8E6_9FIRM|nr:DNA translocase FtsK [Candidatus Pullilachnospira gallistercoris]